jgi:hypothetical protein
VRPERLLQPVRLGTSSSISFQSHTKLTTSKCGTTKDHCDASTCLKSFSSGSSACKPATPTTLKTTTTKKAPTSPATGFPQSVPVIDVCGRAQGGVTCPGAGANGYFYRCCSSAGHCGPKNDIQDQALYCGDGCQAGFGKCDSEQKPAEPAVAAGPESGDGEVCGPIVNRKCKSGLCCSGSNFCGSGEDFCGKANWCQSKWGKCN